MSSITADSLQKYINETWPKVSPLVSVKKTSDEKLISVTFCGSMWIQHLSILGVVSEKLLVQNALSFLRKKLDYFECIIDECYYKRAFIYNASDKDYPYVHTWFRTQEHAHIGLVLLDHHNNIIMNIYTYKYHKTLTVLENFLRQYEECHKSSIRDIIRSLPSPITNAILEYC